MASGLFWLFLTRLRANRHVEEKHDRGNPIKPPTLVLDHPPTLKEIAQQFVNGQDIYFRPMESKRHLLFQSYIKAGWTHFPIQTRELIHSLYKYVHHFTASHGLKILDQCQRSWSTSVPSLKMIVNNSPTMLRFLTITTTTCVYIYLHWGIRDLPL